MHGANGQNSTVSTHTLHPLKLSDVDPIEKMVGNKCHYVIWQVI